MKRWLALIVSALLLVLVGLGVKLWRAVDADPTPIELAERTPAKPTVWATTAGTGFTVTGVVTNLEGEGVQTDVLALDAYTDGQLERVTTDLNGEFRIDLDRPAQISPTPGPYDEGRELVHTDRDDLVFIVPDRCPLHVEVFSADGPVSGANVKAWIHDPTWGRYSDLGRTDDEGQLPLDLTLCGPGTVEVQAEGFASARVPIDTLNQGLVRVELDQGVLVTGVVEDETGAPVAAGTVRANTLEGTAFEGGTFEIRLSPGDWKIKVVGHDEGAIGYRSQNQEIVLDEPTELFFELDRFQRVDVYCAGLPDDRCEGVLPIRCDVGILPGDICYGGASGTECECPLEDAVVRSPEEHVEVLPGEGEVWLDYRDKGAIIGTIAGCPAPSECAVFSGQLAIGKTGTPPAHGTLIGPDGRFELRGLNEGTWGLAVGWPAGVRDLPDVPLGPGEVVDLGVIDVGGSGGVAGVVYDGLTGETRQWSTVMIRATDHDSSVNPFGSMAMTGPDGEFELTGLPRGEYEVFLAQRPMTREVVNVRGSVVSGLVLETAEASVLDEQGFGVDDELVVSSIDPDGWAAEAGLLQGDAIVGVTMMGMDTTMLDPTYSELAAQTVLRHYSGELGLVVERDGELFDVELQ